jgi:hypothetical protein
MPSRKRNPKPDCRRALELLAGSRDGCTEAIMLAHGFTIAQMTAHAECYGRWRTLDSGRVRADYGVPGDQPVLKPSAFIIAKVLQHDTPIVAHTSGIRRF